MGSIFDDIFKPSGALPLASLFSQRSNFRAGQAPNQAAKPASDVTQHNLADSAPANTQTSDKKSKGTKKRKHSTLEVEETAAQVSNPTQKATVKESTQKAEAPSDAQKPQSSEQPQLPGTKPSKSKDPKRKAKPDLNVKASEPLAITTADQRPRKQKKLAKTPDSNAGAAQEIAGITQIGNSSSGITQLASQQDDAQIAAQEQEALQVILCSVCCQACLGCISVVSAATPICAIFPCTTCFAQALLQSVSVCNAEALT